MAKAYTDDRVIECGFCFQTDTLDDPRVLPCTHVHCMNCLAEYFELNKRVQCPLPICKYVSYMLYNNS